MATEIKRINPLDLQPRKAIGVDLPLSGKAVFNQTFQTKDALKANLLNYFLTNKGERYLNTSFGSNLKSLLFENINNSKLLEIEELIREDLKVFFPRIEPSLLELRSNPDSNTVVFFLRYALIDSNIEDEVVINFEQ
jgi:phage baseplate assembly protein W